MGKGLNWPSRTLRKTVLLSVALIVQFRCQLLSGVGAVPECFLEVHGRSDGSGAGTAAFTCRGGTVTAAVNGTLMGSSKQKFTGVEWDKEHCGQPACLITLCGDTVAKLTVNATGLTSPWTLDDMEVRWVYGSGARCLHQRALVGIWGMSWQTSYSRETSSIGLRFMVL
jgi:hypothetical protein